MWARDFDAMREIGIDTVILIRTGTKDRMVFESKVRILYLKGKFNGTVYAF